MEIKQTKQSLNHIKIKYHNQKRILNLIQSRDGISRADIAKELNLSKPAVSSNISELLLANIIFEDGTNDSSGGRRPIMVKFNSRYGIYVSIIIKPSRLKIIYFNIKGEIVFENSFKMDLRNEEPSVTFDKMKEHIQKDLKELELTNMICIIISFPGIIKDNKILASNSMPKYNDLNIANYLEDTFNCKVLLANDMNVKVIGMHDRFINMSI